MDLDEEAPDQSEDSPEANKKRKSPTASPKTPKTSTEVTAKAYGKSGSNKKRKINQNNLECTVRVKLDELYEKNGEAVDMNDVAASVDLDREEVMRRCKDIVDQFEYDKKIKVLHKYPSDESDSEEIIVDHRGREAIHKINKSTTPKQSTPAPIRGSVKERVKARSSAEIVVIDLDEFPSPKAFSQKPKTASGKPKTPENPKKHKDSDEDAPRTSGKATTPKKPNKEDESDEESSPRRSPAEKPKKKADHSPTRPPTPPKQVSSPEKSSTTTPSATANIISSSVSSTAESRRAGFNKQKFAAKSAAAPRVVTSPTPPSTPPPSLNTDSVNGSFDLTSVEAATKPASAPHAVAETPSAVATPKPHRPVSPVPKNDLPVTKVPIDEIDRDNATELIANLCDSVVATTELSAKSHSKTLLGILSLNAGDPTLKTQGRVQQAAAGCRRAKTKLTEERGRLISQYADLRAILRRKVQLIDEASKEVDTALHLLDSI